MRNHASDRPPAFVEPVQRCRNHCRAVTGADQAEWRKDPRRRARDRPAGRRPLLGGYPAAARRRRSLQPVAAGVVRARWSGVPPLHCMSCEREPGDTAGRQTVWLERCRRRYRRVVIAECWHAAVVCDNEIIRH